MAFIIKPLVTEKMTKITDKQPNRYGFVVRPEANNCLLYTSPSPRDAHESRMPSSA